MELQEKIASHNNDISDIYSSNNAIWTCSKKGKMPAVSLSVTSL